MKEFMVKLKTLYTILLFVSLFSVPSFGQNNLKSNRLDTILVLECGNNKVVQFDSLSLLNISLEFSKDFSDGKNYINDSIIKYQNNLVNHLKLKNIDTVIIEGFLKEVNLSNILSELTNVNVVYIYGYSRLNIIKDSINLPSSTIKTLYVISTDFVDIDLSCIEKLEIETLILSVQRENKKNRIIVHNQSKFLKQIIIDSNIPKTQFFKIKRKLKRRNRNLLIESENIYIPNVNIIDKDYFH